MRPLMMILVLLWASVPGWSQTTLGASQELTLNPPWSGPLALEFPGPGRYRLEAAGLAGDAVEVIVDRRGADGQWKPAATNRTLKGTLEVQAEWAVDEGGAWRVRPLTPVRQTLILRLRKAAFSSLRDTLKQDLTAGTAVPLPLRKRLELPLGTGGTGLAAAPGPRGELWLGWLNGQGSAEVWSTATGKRIGNPLVGPTPWTGLALGGTETPSVTLSRGSTTEARVWTGLDWAVEAAPGTQNLTTAQGTFRYDTGPVPRVYRAAAGGWADLELPRNRMLDRLLLGSTTDGLYAFLASSTGQEREFYAWTPGSGWSALPPPAAEGPPRAGLWSATNGAGTLFHLEGQGPALTLQSYDGTAWTRLDLSLLVPGGAQSAFLVPPSSWSKTGTLAVSSDRVAVYDLP